MDNQQCHKQIASYECKYDKQSRNYIQEILRKGDLYEKQMSGFAKVREILGQGVQMPSQNVCDVIIDIVNKSKKR